MSKKPSILDALATVTAEDLKQLDDEIAALRRKLDTLEEARKLVNVAVNGKPERVKPGTKKPKAADGAAGKPDASSTAAKVAACLMKSGVTSIAKIGEKMGVSYQTVYGAVRANPDSFQQTAQGIVLTPEGKKTYAVEAN